AAVEARAAPAAGARAALPPAETRLRRRRPPLRDLNRPARIGDRGKRMREHDAGIGEKAAPVARMVAALAQVDDEIDRVAAARAKEQRRPVGRDARPIRGDQEIGLEKPVLMRLAQLAQPDGADFFAHLDQELDVEAEPPALAKDSRKASDVD